MSARVGMNTRPSLDLRLYLVTDTTLTASHGLGICAVVQAAVAGGVTAVQLRDKDASDAEFVALGQLVSRVLEGTGVPLIVNDRVHLVPAIGAAGAHIGQDDLSPARARDLLGPTPYLGLSCTTLDQVRAAQGLPEGTVDHLGIGPLRATATKTDHAEPLGLAGIGTLAAASTVPTVAIGGIQLEDVRPLQQAGVDGLAVVSAICAAPDPQAAAAALRAAWEGRR